MRRRGRPSGGSGTSARTAILDAARDLFGERGYDQATIRAIAQRAGVDAALVHHYYGTKHDLFVAAVDFPVEIESLGDGLRAADPARLGEVAVRFFLAAASDPKRRHRILAILRSATSSELVARMVRTFVTRVLVEQMRPVLGDVPDAQLRAELAASQLVGMNMLRYVIKPEPLASISDDEVVALVGPTIQRYLTGEL